MSACFPRAHSDGPPTLLISRRCVDNQWEAGETREGDTKGRKMDSGPKGGGYELQNGRLCRIQSWRHRAKTLCDRVAGSAPDERGGGGGGGLIGRRGNFLWPGGIGDHPSILCAGRGIGLAPLPLGTGGYIFSQGGQQEKCIFPPDAFQRKANVAGIFYGRGGSNWRDSPGNVSIHRQRGPSITRALVYYSQEEPGRDSLRTMGGLCGSQRLRSDRSTSDHARRSVSFACVFLHRPSY